MSYEHLAGRLIETQRSLLGQRAVDIAQDVDGLTVTAGGNVTDVVDDDRDVIGTLVDRYVSVLGRPAQQRLQSAATEFEAEVVLPANLGGPTSVPTPDGSSDNGSGAEPAATGGAAGTQLERPEQTDETVVEYSTPSNTMLTGDIESTADLSSVYVIAEDENGWEWRLTVEDAVLNAVTRETELSVGDVGELHEYVDATVIEAALGADGAVSFSFEIEGYHVTLQPDGNVRIR
jgi:uncharacterized protein YbjQ (UPF0145 family)